MADQILLRVDSLVLRQTAQEVKNLNRLLQDDFQELLTIVRNSRYYWTGIAADTCRESFQEKSDDVSMMMKRMARLPDDLLTMTGIYEKTESAVTQQTSALPVSFLEEG